VTSSPRRSILACLMTALIVVQGCLGRPAPSTSTVSRTTTGDAPAGDISYSAFGDAAELAVFEALIDAYRQRNPRVTVNLNVVPNQNDFMTRLSAAFTAGSPPDVFLINYRRYGQFASKGVLEPLEDWMVRGGKLHKEDFFELPLKAFTWNGKLQCIPQNQSSLVVYYNRDVFTKYRVPFPNESWTWADFLNTARALTLDVDDDGTTDLHGLTLEPSIIRAAPFIWQHGGRIVDDEDAPTRITLDDPKTVEALVYFIRLHTFFRVSPNEAEYKAEGPDSRFMTGKAAMTLNSRRVVPEFRTIKGFSWDVAALPSDEQKATTLHSDAYCIAASSPNKVAAWDFVEFTIGPEGQEITARLGRTVPSLKAVANSPAFLDPSLPPANSRLFLDLAPHLRLLPMLAEWPSIERIVSEEIESAFFGAQSARDSIATANRRANDQLKR